jgi:hypothetical protein
MSCVQLADSIKLSSLADYSGPKQIVDGYHNESSG